MLIPDSGGYVNGFNVNLSNISLRSADPDEAVSLGSIFRQSTIRYTNDVDYEVNSLLVTAFTVDSGALLKINGTAIQSGVESPPIGLDVGTTKSIIITVTSPDGKYIKTYTVEITRLEQEQPGSNANLFDLVIDNGYLAPEFLPTGTNYTLELAYTDPLSVTFTPYLADEENATLSVTIDGTVQPAATDYSVDIIDVGVPYYVEIEVTAENGIAKTYYITIIRKTISDNADLAALSFSAGDLDNFFDPAITEYNLDIPFAANDITLSTIAHRTDVALIEVQVGSNAPVIYDPDDPESVNIFPLTIGSAYFSSDVTITVTAEDRALGAPGTQKTYTVTLNHLPASTNADLQSLTVTPGSINFDPEILSYTVEIASTTESVILGTLVDDPYASIEINSQPAQSGSPTVIDINDPVTPINILVTAQDINETKQYTVTIHRRKKIDVNVTFPAGLPPEIQAVTGNTLYVKLFIGSIPASWEDSGNQRSTVINSTDGTITLSPEYYASPETSVYAAVFVDKNSNGRPDFGEPAQFYSANSGTFYPYYNIVKNSTPVPSNVNQIGIDVIDVPITEYTGKDITLSGTFSKVSGTRDWKIRLMEAPADIESFLINPDLTDPGIADTTPVEGAWNFSNIALTSSKLMFVVYESTSASPDVAEAVYILLYTIDSSASGSEFSHLSDIIVNMNSMYIIQDGNVESNAITVSGTLDLLDLTELPEDYTWRVSAYDSNNNLRAVAEAKQATEPTDPHTWEFLIFDNSAGNYNISLYVIATHKTADPVIVLEYFERDMDENQVFRTIGNEDITGITFSVSNLDLLVTDP